MKDYPLGQNIPDSMHAVCASLPTMDAVIGYEEGRMEIVSIMHHAYPRFVVHPYIVQVAADIAKRCGLVERALVLLVQEADVAAIVGFIGLEDYSIANEAGFKVLHFPKNAEHEIAAKIFLQHTGVGISSRQAEDYLLDRGQIPEAQMENAFLVMQKAIWYRRCSSTLIRIKFT